MFKRNRALLIGLLILALIIPSFLSFVSSSAGTIRINSTTASAAGQQIKAGGNVNLYFGGVTWSGSQLYLLLSSDGSSQVSSGSFYTPLFSVYDVADTSQTHSCSNANGFWVTGNNWINGSIPATQPVGNWYIKAIDEATTTVAVTDTYITVNAVNYNATLDITPSSGPGGVPITFTGSGYPVGAPVTISYYDSSSGTGVWKLMTQTTASSSGTITVNSEAPDLKKSLSSYDSSEAYTQIQYKSEVANLPNIYSYANYNEYSRGLKTVGPQTANGLFGNGTSLVSTVKVAVGEPLTISGKWFHSSDVIYVRWDSVNVVGTVTSDEWTRANVIGSTVANINGSFTTTITIPQANSGAHYIGVEDSQNNRVIVKIMLYSDSLRISPDSGPGGATVQFTGIGYTPSHSVTLSYLNPDSNTWNYWTSLTSDETGRISFASEIPDLMKTSLSQFSNTSTVLSFRTEVDGVPHSYIDYTQYWRGLSRVGNSYPYYNSLYGNGTDLSSSVTVKPGNSLVISGSWFHPGVVYIRFDGIAVVGTVTGDEWRNAQVIGTTSASSTGSFSAAVTIPTASGGSHYLSIEDSQTRMITKVNVDAAVIPTPAPTVSPTTNPTPQPTPNPSLPTPSIDLSCGSTITGSGFRVEINGNLALNGAPLADKPILLSYSVTGGNSWESLTLVKTLSDGRFSALWQPDVTGNYLVKATFERSAAMNEASKAINLALTPDPNNNVFTLSSNSTITQFTFNPSTKELSFTAEGPSHTTGYVNIDIPKTLISDISTLKAYIDGREVVFTSQSQSDSWQISFSYSHSSHHITMTIADDAQQPITEPSDAMQSLIYIIPIAAIVIIAIAAVAFKQKSKKPHM